MHSQCSMLGLLLHAMLLLHIMAFSCQVDVRSGVQSDRLQRIGRAVKKHIETADLPSLITSDATVQQKEL